ncbi:MAG: tetratricopeptide repeat protein [Elusimicrobia bacterium]|nr:tetratricopeptide repeat protein [Elusimicrobiota bacterium]
MRLLLAALLTGAALPAPAAEGEAAKDPAPVQTYYQEALDYYAKGDLRRAIGKWNEVLKADASQKSAQSMILQARRRIEVLTEKRRKHSFQLIAEGRYEDARLEIQTLIDQDPGHPQIDALQSRLEDVEKIAKALPGKDKATRAAVLGLKGYLVFPQDLRLAYDALRYAIELDGTDARFKPFLDLVLDEKPDLAEDTVTPGMKLVPYLQMVAVHQIYDGKYYRAVATLDEVLTLEPDDVLALKRLGSAYYSLGEKKRARDAWLKALRLQPDDKTLRKFLAKVGGADAAPRGASGKKAADAVEKP